MSKEELAERLKKIVSEELGVEESKITDLAFTGKF